MQNFEFIAERPSPNVTVNLPWAFDELYRVDVTPHLFREFSCKKIDGVFVFDCRSQPVIDLIRKAFDDAFRAYSEYMYPVGVSGFQNPDGPVGSRRFCTMSSVLAWFFTEVVRNSSMLDVHPTHDESFVQASQYIRAMKYVSGGEHFPHYDTDFHVMTDENGNDLTTRMTLVAYGDDCETGEIAFIRPGIDDGSREDWTRQATEDEIFLKVKPRAGRIVVFDHSICHTVLPYADKGERRILRGDLIYENFAPKPDPLVYNPTSTD